MTAIPGKSSFTGGAVTEGGFKSALESMHDYLTEQLGSAGGRSVDHGSVELVYVTATSVKVAPRDGNRLLIKTGSAWAIREVASAGITATITSCFVDGTGSQTLAASTLYYAYVWDNTGTLTLDFSTSAPAVDATTGVRIKTGLDTRTYVGKLVTDASGNVSAYRVTSAFGSIDGVVRGWEPVEFADLTNGGGDDLAEYDLSHTLEPGYLYWLVVKGISSTDASWFPIVRLRNDAGSWLVSSGDYYFSHIVSGATGLNNQSGTGFSAYGFSGYTGSDAARSIDYEMLLINPMVTTERTRVIFSSMEIGSTTIAVGSSAGMTNATDGHNGIRILVTPGTMDNGSAILMRQREPSA